MPRTAAALRGSDSPGLRDHLVRAAGRLIGERRTDLLTVRGIARDTGVATGVLYNYFEDKEELLALGLMAHIDTVARTLGGPPEPGDASLEADLVAYLRYLLELHDRILPAFAGLLGQPRVIARFRALPAAEKGDDLRGRAAAFVRAQQSLGRIRPDIDAEAAGALLVGACYELVLPRLFEPTTTEPLSVPDGFLADLVRTLVGRWA